MGGRNVAGRRPLAAIQIAAEETLRARASGRRAQLCEYNGNNRFLFRRLK
jgi:hypothetical protein